MPNVVIVLFCRQRVCLPLWMGLVIVLLPVSEDTDGIVLFASSTRICTVTLVDISTYNEAILTCEIFTLDFFSLQRSHALHTRLRMLASVDSREPGRGDEAILDISRG